MAVKVRPFRYGFTSLKEAGVRPSVRDSGGGRVYKGVTIITAGLGNHRDKNYYPAEVLQGAIDKGLFEGLRAYADHQNTVDEEIQPERSIRDIVGLYTNTRFVKEGTGGRAVGDLRILHASKWLSDMVDELIEVGHADKVGISINGRGQTVPTKRRLEESDEEVEVNELKQFIDLRSADVVTEAGAGGGFRQVLESARGAVKESRMDRDKILAELKEAAAAGDTAQIDTLTAQLKECAASGGACTKVTEACGCKNAAVAEADEADAEGDDVAECDGKKKKKGAAMMEADEAEGDALDDAVAEVVADTTEAADEEDDEDAADDSADEDAEGEPVEEPEPDDGEDDKAKESAAPLTAVAKAKAAAAKTPGATVEARKKLTKSDPSTGKGVGTALINKKNPTTKGRPLPLTEAQRDGEIARLTTKVEKLTARNERLAEALRIRSQADMARNLLKESGIPQEVQPRLLKRLVGKTEEQMRSEITFQQELMEAVTGKVRESARADGEDTTLDDFDEVEGAGSSLREAFHGDEGDNDILSLIGGAGVPLKAE